MVLDVPGFQHAAGLGVVVGVNNHGLRWIHLIVCGEHMLSKSRGSYVSASSAASKTENDCPPFWFYRESIRTSVHGNGGNAEVVDSDLRPGMQSARSLLCKVIVWDEATMSNKLALEAVELTSKTYERSPHL